MKRWSSLIVLFVLLQSCKEKVVNHVEVLPSEVGFLDLESAGVRRASSLEGEYFKIATFSIDENEFVKLFGRLELAEIKSPKGYFLIDGKMFDDEKGIRNPDVWTSNGLCSKSFEIWGSGENVIYDREEGYGCYTYSVR